MKELDKLKKEVPKTKRRFVLGDVHGGHKALVQCLERSNFDKENDLLITLGDIADGWSEVPLVVEELLTIKNRVDVRGNHDEWAHGWLKYLIANDLWLSQGGLATKNAYDVYYADLKEKHDKEFFSTQVPYYVSEDNKCFVHGGIPAWKIPIEDNNYGDLTWDRNMYQAALFWQFQHDVRGEELCTIKLYDEVFIGHSTTIYGMGERFNDYVPTDKPLNVSNVWNLDQGGGWGGKLSIMDIDTKEFWQSDVVKTLYLDEKGR